MSTVSEREFKMKLDECINTSDTQNKFILTPTKYNDILGEIKSALQKKKDGEPWATLDYRRMKRYEILTIGDVEKLIHKRSAIEDSIKYFCHTDELYEILDKIHIASGHKRTKCMEKELKKKYCNITREVIDIYLQLCEQCRLKKKRKGKDSVVRLRLNDQMISDEQIDTVEEQTKLNEDHEFILNYQDNVVDSRSNVSEQEFKMKLNECINTSDTQSKFILTPTKYDEILGDIKTALQKKRDGEPWTPLDYRRMKRYEILTIGNAEKLIHKRSAIEDSIKYFCHTDELYEIMHKVHIDTGHKRTKCMEKELKKKYCNITREVIDIYLQLCRQCRLKKKHKGKDLVVKSLLNSQVISGGQADPAQGQTRLNEDYELIDNYQDRTTETIMTSTASQQEFKTKLRTKPEVDYSFVSNYQEQLTNTAPTVSEQEFKMKLDEYLNNFDADNKFILTPTKYNNILGQINSAMQKKTNGEPWTTLDYRRMKRYEILTIENAQKLIQKRSTIEDPIKYFCHTDELYEIIHKVHIDTRHKQTRCMEKELKKKYRNITREVIRIYLRLCKQCRMKKNHKEKAIEIRLLVSNYMNSRGQVDLIDMQTKPDRDYKFILSYQDQSTKFIFLRPLKSKQVDEVAYSLVDIFCIIDAPLILQNDDREFIANVIKKLAHMFDAKIVHGKARHSNNQESAEYLNQDILDILVSWMVDNNTTSWADGLRFVQLKKNRSSHKDIKRSPYEAMFGVPVRVGLMSSAFPHEAVQNMHTEEELQVLINENSKLTTPSESDEEEEPSSLQEHFIVEAKHTIVNAREVSNVSRKRHAPEKLKNSNKKCSLGQ